MMLSASLSDGGSLPAQRPSSRRATLNSNSALNSNSLALTPALSDKSYSSEAALAPVIAHHLGLRTSWWEWPQAREATRQAYAWTHERQPDVVPLRNRVLTIGGASMTSLRELVRASVRLPSQSVIEEDGITYFAIDVRTSDDTPSWRVRRRYSEFRDFAKRLILAGIALDADGVAGGEEMSNTRLKRLSSQRCARSTSTGTNLGSNGASFSERWSEMMDQLTHRCCNADLSCDGADFPRKCLRHCEGDKLARRRHKLELWLRVVLVVARRIVEKAAQGALDKDPVGRFIQMKSTGRVGRITRHCPGDAQLSYKVQFDDDVGIPADWHAAREVDVLPAGWRPWMADLPCFLCKGRNTTRKAPTKDRSEVATLDQLMFVQVRVPTDMGPGEELAVLLPDAVEIVIVIPFGTGPGTILGLWYDTRASTLALAG